MNTDQDLRIPIRTPDPVTDDDVAALYERTNECAVVKRPEGWFVEIEPDREVVDRVLAAMAEAGFEGDVPEFDDSARLESTTDR